MSITDKQIEARRKHLGGSDLPAMLGLSKYKSAYDLYLDKAGQLVDQEQTEAMRRGQYLEPAILHFAEDELGALRRNQYRSAKDLPIGTNVDALVVDGGNPVEAKSSMSFVGGEWGALDTEVPDDVMVQSHGHLIVTNKEICYVPVVLGNLQFRMYHVPRNDRLVELIARVANAFWEDCVLAHRPPTVEWYQKLGLKGMMPFACEPSLNTLKRVRRLPASTVGIEEDLVTVWQGTKAITKAAKVAEEAAYAQVLKGLGDAEAGLAGEAGNVTYFEQTRREKAREAREVTFRVLRHTMKEIGG